MIKIELDSVKVLVIDDEPFMRNVVARFLRELGVQDIIAVGDGHHGMEIIQDKLEPVDLVICDLEMPRMDGFAFVMKLRALPDPKQARTPVIILTGHSESENVQTAVKIGINGFLVKPLTKVQLQKMAMDALLSPMINTDVADPEPVEFESTVRITNSDG